MKIFTIAVNDIKLILKDPKALIILLLMPFVLISILGFVFGNLGSTGLNHFDIAVLSEDQGDTETGSDKILNMGELLTNFVLKGKLARDTFNVIEVDSYDSGIKMVQNGTVSAFVYVPVDFTVNYLAGNNVRIEVLGDQRKIYTPKVVENFVSAFTDRLNSISFANEELIKMQEQYNLPDEALSEVSSDDIWFLFDEIDVNIIYEGVTNRKSVPGIVYYGITMAVMFALFSGQEGAIRMLQERKLMTAARISISPVSSFTYLLGKLVGIICLVLVQMLVLLYGSALLFKVSWGNISSILIMSISIAICIGSLALFVGSISASSDTALKLYNLCIWVFSFLGGTFIPRNMLPQFINNIGRFTPNGQALNGYLKIVQGAPLGEWISHAIILSSIGAIVLFITLVNRKGMASV